MSSLPLINHPAVSSPAAEVIFLMDDVPDLAGLLQKLPTGKEVHVLSSTGDGLAQMADVLDGRSAIPAIHLVSHGAQGQLQLGSTQLSAAAIDTVATYQADLARISAALAPGADWLLYGCDAGGGEAGAQLVAALASATGADVAASTDATGAAALGGNWILERHAGQIDSPTAWTRESAAQWQGLLSTYDFSSGTMRDNSSLDGNVEQTLSGVKLSVNGGSSHDAYIWDVANYGNLTFSQGTSYLSANSGYLLIMGQQGVADTMTFTFDSPVDLTSLDLGDGTDLTGMTLAIASTNTSATATVTVPAQTDTRAMLNWTGVTGFTIKVSGGGTLPLLFLDNLVATPSVSAPTTTVSTAALSADTGTSSTDFITKTAAQTISGTLSASLASGEYVEVSYNNGSTWSNAGTYATGSSSWSTTTTLSGSGTFQARVSSSAGSSTAYSHTYTLDTTASTNTIATAALSADTGTSSTDFITKTAAQTISGTLASNLASGEYVEVSIDNGSTWSTATTSTGSNTWSLSTTLSSSSTLKVRVTDTAGNTGTVYSQAYTLDTAAPTVTITSDVSSLKIGETATITFTFSEDPGSTFTWNGSSGDVTVSGGTLGAITGSGLTRTATFTPTASTNGGTASITVASSAYADTAGNNGGAGTTPSLTFDTLAPTNTIASAALSADTGTSSTDFITKTAAQTISGTLASNLASGEYVEVSIDNGGTWNTATTSTGSNAWSLSSVTLSSSNTLQVRVADTAGNTGTAYSQAYTLDTTAPTNTIATASFSADTGTSSTDFITKTAAQTISGTLASNLASGDLVEVSTDNGSTWSTATTSTGSDTWSLSSVTLSSSSTLKVRVTDTAGNTGTVYSQAYTLDTSAPAVGTPDLDSGSDLGISGTDDITGDTTPTFTGTAESGSTVILYDTDGTTQLGSTTATGGTWTITSSTLSEGVHTVTAKATDTAGNTSAASSGLSATIDTTPPTNTIATAAFSADTGTSSTDFITKTAAQTISGTLASNLASGEYVEVSIDNGATWSTATTSTGSNAWSLSTTLTTSSTLKVRVSDSAGSTGTTYSQAYVLDSSAPSIGTPDLDSGSDVGISSTDDITTDTTPTFTGTAESGTTVVLYDTDGTTQLGSTTASGGTWTITSTALSEGVHTVTAKATDTAGNTSSASSGLAVTIDTTAPTNTVAAAALSADTGTSATDFITTAAAQTISGTLASNLASGEYVEVSIDNGATWSTATTSTGSNAWSLSSVTLSSSDTLKVRVTDTAGNTGTAYSQAYTLDTTAPTNTIATASFSADTGTSSTDFITKTAAQTVSGTLASNLASGEYVEVSVNNGSTWSTATTSTGSNTWSLSSVTLSSSSTLKVRVTDTAGNTGTLYSRAYTLDTSAPAVGTPDLDSGSDLGISSTDDITGDTTPTFTGTAESGSTVILYDTDGTTQLGSTTATGGTWTITSSTLSEGVHTVTAKATDTAGNTSAASSGLAVTIDTTPPTNTIATAALSADTGTSATDFITKTAAQTISGTLASNLASGEYVEVSIDNGATWSTATTSTGSNAWSLSSVTLSSSNTLKVRVSDSAGSTGSEFSQAYTLDTTAPAVTITSDVSSLKIGETATITFTFSEDPGATFTWDGSSGDVTVSGGTLGAITGSGLTRTATFTPAASTNGGTASITVASSAYTDTAGNNGGAGTTPSLTFDTLAPTNTVASAAFSADTGTSSTDFITKTAAQTISGTLASNLASGEYVEVSVDNGATWSTATTSTGSNAWSLSSVTLSSSNTLKVRVTDTAGNTGTVHAQAYTLDTGAPSVGTPDLDSGSDLGISSVDDITGDATPTFTGTAESGSTVVLYDTDGTTQLGSATATGGTWSITSGTLGDGAHTVTAKATDIAGNTSAASTGLAVTIDTTAPTNTVAAAALSADTGTSATDFITQTAAQTISGTLASNLASGEYVEVSVDNGATWSTATTSTGSNAWSLSSVTLSSSNTLKVRVADAAGNKGSIHSQAYTLDTTAPANTIATAAFSADTGTSSTDFITKTAAQTISGTLAANLASGESVQVSIDNGATWSTATASTGSNTWSLPATLTSSGTLQARVADAAGNTGTVHTQAYTLDTTAPAVAITSNAAALKAGETATVTFTFTEDPGSTFMWDGSSGDVTVTGGTLGAISGSGTTRTATFTPSAATNGGTASITVAASSYTDAAGNNGGAGTTPVLAFDTLAPTVAITSDKAALKAGETATITFTFSEDPGATFTWNGGSGDVVVTGGTLGAISGSGTTRTATFTPTASANAGTASITVAASSYTDTAGNGGGAGTTPVLAFDTLAPTVAITSDKTSLRAGETATITFTFSEDPGSTFTWNGSSGDVTVTGGTLSAISGSGTTRTATFTPGASVNSGTASITVAASAYTDTAGNNGAAGTSPSLSFDTAAPGTPSVSLAQDTGAQDGITSNGQVNVGNIEGGASWEYSTDGGASWTGGSGTGFTLTGNGAKAVLVRQTDSAGNTGDSAALNFTLDTAAINGASISLSDNALKIGETANVTIGFAAPVSGFDASDLQVSNGTISGLASGDGGKTWSGVFTPNANVTSAVNSITLNLADVTTAAGTPGTGAASSATFAIDTAAPTSTVSVADATLGSGAVTSVTVAFSEAVTGFGLDDMTAANGTLSNLSSSDGGKTWTAALTPAAGVSATGNVVTVANAGVQDAAGNAGAGSAVSNPYAVNTPGMGATVSVSDADLLAGETAQVTVTFNQKVGGDVAAAMAAKNGTLDGWSVSADGLTWTAALTPATNVTAVQNTVSVNLAALTDGSGKPGQGTVLSGNYAVHTVRPTATVTVVSDTLLKGESSDVRIVFSEAVTGFGSEDLNVPSASLSGLSTSDGGKTWTARLVPQENASVPLNMIALDLSGVRNAAGNGGNSGLGLAQSNLYAVATLDGVRSTVDGVATITQSTPNSSGGKTVVVPVITTSRPEDPASEHSTLADIPLGLTSGTGGNSLLVSLPTGTGMQSEGPTTPLTGNQALLDLIMRIESKTAPGSNTQDEMKDLGTGFLGELGSAPLETKTLVPTAAAGAASAGTIIISGNPVNPVGLVIDTSHLPSNSTLQLDNVDFAAVVGNVTLRGGEGRNIVIGDDAVQNIYLGAEDDVLAGGGGDDFVGSAGGNDRIDGGSGNDVVAGGIGNDTLSGGTGADMVQGGRSDIGSWKVTLTADGVLAATHGNAIFAAGGTETLQRGDFNAQGENLGFLSASTDYLIGVSLLYRAAFGRAPELAGLSYWSQPGMRLSDLAQGILKGAEWLSDKAGNLSDTQFVQTVYRHALGREAEAGGLAYWLDVLAGSGGKPGASRADVLQTITLSEEHRKAAAGIGGYTIAEDRATREMGWIAGSGDDMLDGGAGSDVLVGGDGTDTVTYGGKLAGYRFVLGKDGHVMVADKANADIDTLSSIETGAFSDGNVDLRFLQSKPSELATLGMLYQSVLDRAGDLGGFKFWLDQHRATADLVQGFLRADEVKARYDGLGDTAFVQALYANAGLAQTAAGGVQAWTAFAATHTRAELVGAWIADGDVQAAQFAGQGLWIV